MNSTSSLELLTVNTSSYSPLSTNGNRSGVGTSYSQSYGITTSMIVRSVIFCIIMLLSIFGNSLILTAIRTTPSLKTKTNKILASLTISDLWAGGIATLYNIPFNLITSLNPCAYRVSRVIMIVLMNLPPYASCFNLIIVAIDRYVAIVHPLKYEMRMTDTVVNCMIAAAWLISLLCSSSFTLWLINADMTKCNIVPVKYYFINPCVYMLVGTVVTFVYVKILLVAWHQHVAIQQSTTAVAAPPVNTVQSNVQRSDSISIVAQQQQQHIHQHKSRKTQFKALRLTLVIVGAFLLLWFPFEVGRGLQFVGDTRPIVADMLEVGMGIGLFNSSINWILYGASSKAYQKAFRRLLGRFIGLLAVPK